MARRLYIISAAAVASVVSISVWAQSAQPETIEQLQETLKRLQAEVQVLQGKIRMLAGPANASPAIPARQQALDSYRLGRQLEEQKQYQAAIAAFSQSIASDPSSDSAYLHRGLSYAKQGAHDSAVADYSRSLALQPNNSQTYLARATSYAAAGQNANALLDADQAIARNGRNPEAYLLRGRLYQQDGKPELAAADMARAEQLDPQSEKLFLARAADFQSAGQSERALAECEKAVRLNPNSAAAYLCRAESHLKLNDVSHALEDVNRAVVTGQTLQQPLPFVDDLATGVRNVAGGAKEVTPAAAVPTPLAPVVPSAPPASPRIAPKSEAQVALAPTSTEALRLLQMGRDFVLQNRFSEAMVPLTKAIELDSSWARPRNMRGYAFMRLRQYAQANDDFSEAIRLRPGFANAYVNRAAIRRLMGDREGAGQDVKKAAELIAGEALPRNRSAALSARR
jgi:tetratricopeptide (TPR) repeat protein